MQDDYTWDDMKSESNKTKHGFEFAVMYGFDWEFAICVGEQIVDSEKRELWLGPISSTLVAVVTLERDDTIRIISLRDATNHEKKIWRKEFHNG